MAAPQPNWSKAFALAAGLALPVCLALLAGPSFLEGIGLEQTRSAVGAALVGRPLPLAQDRAAAAKLEWTLADNGDGLIARAELIALGANGQRSKLLEARSVAIEGLMQAPANPQGWTLVCEIDAVVHDPGASQCMETGFFVAPFDWYVARRRALLAAFLWPELSGDLQDAAGRRVLLMWETSNWLDGGDSGTDNSIERALYDVWKVPNGAALLTRGFRQNKLEMRIFNQWLIHKAIRGE